MVGVRFVRRADSGSIAVGHQAVREVLAGERHTVQLTVVASSPESAAPWCRRAGGPSGFVGDVA